MTMKPSFCNRLFLLLGSLLFISSFASAAFLGSGSHLAKGPDHEMRFEPRQPEPLFESEGGRILQWKDPMMTHMGLMEGRKVTINQQSLLLPQYANSHRLLVVLCGRARMGLMLPMGTKANMRRVYKGEIIAIPRGMPMWMLNDGDEPCSFLTFANIRRPMMHGHHRYEVFHLAGAESEDEMGGIMHGFSKEMLMAAMDLDDKSVTELMKNQDGVAIVKMSRMPKDDDREKGHHERDWASDETQVGGGGVMVDFGYRMDMSHRDIFHPRAGELTIANGFKLPVLKLMGMSVGCLKLNDAALTAPGWFTNADYMIYCARGSARVQVVCPNGKMACDVEMKEGTMMMVPKNYPFMMQAGRDGFEAVLMMNSHWPIAMHMTGKDSMFNMMPREVRMGTFQIGADLDRQVHEESSRRHATFLLPPGRRSPRGKGEQEETVAFEEEEHAHENHIFNLDEIRKAVWSMFQDNRELIELVME